jgi:hypothetical protein
MRGKFMEVEWTVYSRLQTDDGEHLTGYHRIQGRTIAKALARFEKVARAMNEIGAAFMRAVTYGEGA